MPSGGDWGFIAGLLRDDVLESFVIAAALWLLWLLFKKPILVLFNARLRADSGLSWFIAFAVTGALVGWSGLFTRDLVPGSWDGVPAIWASLKALCGLPLIVAGGYWFYYFCKDFLGGSPPRFRQEKLDEAIKKLREAQFALLCFEDNAEEIFPPELQAGIDIVRSRETPEHVRDIVAQRNRFYIAWSLLVESDQREKASWQGFGRCHVLPDFWRTVEVGFVALLVQQMLVRYFGASLFPFNLAASCGLILIVLPGWSLTYVAHAITKRVWSMDWYVHTFRRCRSSSGTAPLDAPFGSSAPASESEMKGLL